MTSTPQLVGAASLSVSVLLLLTLATSAGAALGRHEANLRQAADNADLARRREALRAKQQRIWVACYAPRRPTSAPTCHVRAETVPLRTVPRGPRSHRKG
ncbi:hypothetical protein [Streptomyces sp. DSM 40484]|uniref:hypothetical protein n=1 Tax=Streptomyces kroppenstedtii TaxID=3051181 RepID=UPI0028D4B087|nr:hypothetical protein [Streptomyces sp. DSM 40484]